MLPQTDTEAKRDLKALISQLSEALQQSPLDQAEVAEAEKPNKTMIQISGEGLKQAA